MEQATELQSELQNFIGTEQYFVNPMYRWLRYTDGVKYFATNAGGGAYWLLDIIGTELFDLGMKHRFMCVNLNVEGDWAELTVTDGDYAKLYSRKIEYTDCPAGLWRFFLQNGVLMLTSEY